MAHKRSLHLGHGFAVFMSLLLIAWIFAIDYAGNGRLGLCGMVYRLSGRYDEVGKLKNGDVVYIDFASIYQGRVLENDREREIITLAFGPWGPGNPYRMQYDEFCILRDGK